MLNVLAGQGASAVHGVQATRQGVAAGFDEASAGRRQKDSLRWRIRHSKCRDHLSQPKSSSAICPVQLTAAPKADLFAPLSILNHFRDC